MPKNPGTLDWVGLEFEAERVLNIEIQKRMNSNFWRIDHDASVESPIYRVGNMLFEKLPSRFMHNFGSSSVVTLGTEIVLSPPFSLESGGADLLEEIQKLLNLFMELGERPRSKRAGIHIHIACPMSINFLKTCLAVGAHLEDLFFLLGTQGYTYRGELANDNSYCRPITRMGPPYMPSASNSGLWGPIFSIDELLLTKTIKEFWWRFGNVNPNSETEHMNPARYNWLNLYSLLAHQTLEFRVFNTTLNPYLVFSEILFCQAFAKYCLSLSLTLDDTNSLRSLFPEHSVYDKRGRLEILNSFNEFTDRTKLSSAVKLTLGNMLTNAPEVNLPEQRIKSHILQTQRGRGKCMDFSNFQVKYVTEDELKTAEIDDVHTRRGEPR